MAPPTCPIEDYALVGDCETAALVGRDGSIDWLCWPRFDSAACFAGLVGSRDNGRWLMSAADPKARIRRRYRDSTLILETAIETADGAATVVDFMPPRDQASAVVRLVFGRRGRLAMRTELIIRFDYGSLTPWVTRLHDGSLHAVAGPDMVVLRTAVPLRGVDFRTVGEFTISAGETVPFVLSYGPSHLPPPQPIDPAKALAATEAFWSEWIGEAQPAGEWSEAVARSLITLKALSYRPSGAIAAAPTASLPEQLGGSRNWDYRYCWLRDATFTLVTLMNAGYYDDARAWREWLLRAVAGDPARVQIMYGMMGEHRLPEWEVPWLAGYDGSKPVRIGNAAHQQLQLLWRGDGRAAPRPSREVRRQRDRLGSAAGIAQAPRAGRKEPDHGIWEVRGEPRQFTHSKVMAWVAFDRAVKSVEQFGMEGPIERWRALRNAIHEEVCRFGFNADVGAFVQSYDLDELDASALLIPWSAFFLRMMRGCAPRSRRCCVIS